MPQLCFNMQISQSLTLMQMWNIFYSILGKKRNWVTYKSTLNWLTPIFSKKKAFKPSPQAPQTHTLLFFSLTYFLLSHTALLFALLLPLPDSQTHTHTFYFTCTFAEGDSVSSDTSFSFLSAVYWSFPVQSCLKYFLGGGLGFDDLGFLTRISVDFLAFCKGWLPSLQVRGELLSKLFPDNEYSRPGCLVIGTSMLCTLSFKSLSWYAAPLLHKDLGL